MTFYYSITFKTGKSEENAIFYSSIVMNFLDFIYMVFVLSMSMGHLTQGQFNLCFERFFGQN